MDAAGMDPELFAPALFKNPKEKYVLVKPDIISLKTLKLTLVNAGMLDAEEEIPQILIIYSESPRPNLISRPISTGMTAGNRSNLF